MTLQLKYLFIRLRGARYYKQGSHDPTIRAYKSKHKRKLSWLSGSTRRHFPVREATKDEQIGCQFPHIPSISNHTHNMLDMCKYNMASQHDSTTQVFYSIGSEERDITNMGLTTQHSEHTSQNTSGSLTCLSTNIYKWKRLRSLSIYTTLPRV